MPLGASAETIYLVDAHALIFQVFHAIPEMSSPSGLPTNALFGFTRDLLTLRAENPMYLLCAFDVAGPTFRDKLYPDYKAQRPPMPDNLRLQIPLIQDLLQAMNVPILGVTGFEADDVIATVARQAAQRGFTVRVCTSDKDCRQLIDDRIHLYNVRKQQIFDRDALRQDWGITPEQVVDFQTLVGDAVDNVPGVRGIGAKTAAKLLQEHTTLDQLVNVARQLSTANGKSQKQGGLTPRLTANLLENPEKVELSRTLVRLKTDVPLDMEWDNWRVRAWDAPRLLTLFRDWGFHRFADQVRKASEVQASPAVVGAAVSSIQGEMFPFGANLDNEETPSGSAETKAQEGKYHLVDTPEALASFLVQLSRQQRLAIDLETTALEPRLAAIVGFSFCWQAGEAWYVAVRGPAGEKALDPATTLAQLRPILENPNVAKVNQNIKYDRIVLKQHGVEVAGVAGDSMVADYLLHAGERSHGMEELARQHLGRSKTLITELIGKGKHQLRMDQVPPARIAAYSGEDADFAWQLCAMLEPQLAAQGLGQLYENLEIPLIEVLAELEFNGIRLDVPLLSKLSREMALQLAQLESEIYRLAGHPFNIASLKQLRQVLFDELKLPVQRKTGITGEASTDQETLERLASLGHELPKKLLVHRQIAKLKGTYVDALPEMVNPTTGRIHASFNQTVAATGRLSSSDPNLQNIPIRTEQGGQIRQAFLPEPGWVLLTADYSQVELRLLAHFCGDAALKQAFAANHDIHASVAAQIFNVPESEVTDAMRRVAKTVNFGVLYGMSAHGLAVRLGVPREEAAKFIHAYFARFPDVEQYQQALLEKCRQTGFVSTILGRRRPFDPKGIRPNSTYQQRNQPEREAINMEIQGSAADLLKLAMLNLYRRLKQEQMRSRMLLTVHDELVFETPLEEASKLAEIVREEMTTAMKLDVPLQVDIGVGPNWLEIA